MNPVTLNPSIAALPPAPTSGVAGAAAQRTPEEAKAKPAAANRVSLDEAVTAANKHLQGAGSQLEFQIDERSGRTLMKLIDRETGSVIRQLPSEEMLAIARALDKYKGLVIALKA
jgi:flagellar protein FlaG